MTAQPTEHARLYERILDDMSDGVMAVTRQGIVVGFNPMAADILGVEAEDVLDGPLFGLFAEGGGNDAFIDTITEAIQDDKPVIDRIVGIGMGDGARSLRVKTSRLRDGGGGIVVVFQDITEIEALRHRDREMAESLKVQHGELQQAYLDLDRKSKELEQTGKRLQLVRLGATGFVLLLFAGLGAFNFLGGLPDGLAPSGASMSGDGSGARSAGALPDLYTVAPVPVQDVVTMSGSLVPGSVVNISAPFSGRVDVKLFEYGVPVSEGSVLLSLSSSEQQTRLADARSAHIKARRSYEDLENWRNGAEVRESRRRLEQAQYALVDAQGKLEDTRRLFERGIIPRQELEGQEQLVRIQRDALASAEAALQSTLERGDEESRHIAALELENARRSLEEAENSANNAIVVAPASGIPFAPVTEKDEQPIDLSVGSRVEDGRTLLSIGDIEQLAVAGQIDEVDVAKVAVGQRVQVSGAAFPRVVLTGQVAAVEAQARAGSAGGRSGLASFRVRVTIPSVPEEARQVVRVGMTASADIIVYENPAALVVPTSAVTAAGEGAEVRVWNDERSDASPTPITLGRPLPGGIEILSGLSPGDRVVLP